MSKFFGKNRFINTALGAAWAGNGDTSKVGKYGSVADPQAWNRMQKAEGRKKELDLAQQSQDQYAHGADTLTGNADYLRTRYDTLYRPMEQGLAREVTAGYNPDYSAINTQAQTDVGDAFDRSAGTVSRNAARMGLTDSSVNTPETQRVQNLDRTASQVYAGNNAVDNAKSRSDELNATRGQQLLALGRFDPYVASSESVGGAQTLGDTYAYQGMLRGAQNADSRSMDMAGANFVGNMFSSFGGGRMADGGEVQGPPREFGGDAGTTISMKQKYDRDVADGKTDKQFHEWLGEQGYELGPDLMVRRQAIAATTQKGAPGPRTPRFMLDQKPQSGPQFPNLPAGPDNSQPVINPGDYMRRPHYACGGIVKKADGGDVSSDDNMAYSVQPLFRKAGDEGMGMHYEPLNIRADEVKAFMHKPNVIRKQPSNGQSDFTELKVPVSRIDGSNSNMQPRRAAPQANPFDQAMMGAGIGSQMGAINEVTNNRIPYALMAIKPMRAMPTDTPPPAAIEVMRSNGGRPVKFANGQVWGLDKNGNPIQFTDYQDSGVYADGGKVDGVPISMQTNDYIVPADVVRKLGRKYFDDMVAKAGG